MFAEKQKSYIITTLITEIKNEKSSKVRHGKDEGPIR